MHETEGKPIYDLTSKRVFVAGHRGMVGQALVRRLESEGCDIVTVNRDLVDLRRQNEVERWMAGAKPDVVFLAAAKVGGIMANSTYPASFLYDNLMIEANVIDAARRVDVEKLVFLGSSCIYPRSAPQPMAENALLTGPLEPTNEWYAIAKISGIKLCQAYRRQYDCNFISAQPTNLYGSGDNFDLSASHVIPALMRKAHDAKVGVQDQLTLWGTGKPMREFLHVDDLADALIFLARTYSDVDIVNVGSGEEVSIWDLAGLICETVGFEGRLVLDRSKPDGMPRKLVDSSKIHEMGWAPSIGLSNGLADTYRWFLDNPDQLRGCGSNWLKSLPADRAL